MKAKDVKHYCRTCGDSFDSTASTSAHLKLHRHVALRHRTRTYRTCHANCSFKMTYEECQAGTMLHGARDAAKRAQEADR